MLATVTRGELVARLTSSGTLKPLQSITYRSPMRNFRLGFALRFSS
jgi:hypothetical protein